MASKDLRVFDLDQNVCIAICENEFWPDRFPAGHSFSTMRHELVNMRPEAAMTFERWRKEAKQRSIAWHNDDPACVDKDHWRQCFDHNYRPWEAARYAAELLHRRATAPVAKG